MPVNIDEATLKRIAEMTNAESFRATDTDSLETIYSAIDELEKTKVESHQYVDYRELAVQTYVSPWGRLPALLSVVLVLLAMRVLLQTLWLRELS